MTIKEQIAQLFNKSDYDMWTSFEFAHNMIQEIKARPKGVYTYYIGNYSIKIKHN